MFPLGHGAVPVAWCCRCTCSSPATGAAPPTAWPATREFGVVLIERGSEVGGGDVRTDVGTVARIVEAERAARRPLGAGRRRRPADPGRALAARRPLPPGRGRATGPTTRSTDAAGARAAGRGRVLVACGGPSPSRPSWARPGPPVDRRARPTTPRWPFQVAAVAPLGPLDQRTRAGATGPVERLAAGHAARRRRGRGARRSPLRGDHAGVSRGGEP